MDTDLMLCLIQQELRRAGCLYHVPAHAMPAALLSAMNPFRLGPPRLRPALPVPLLSCEPPENPPKTSSRFPVGCSCFVEIGFLAEHACAGLSTLLLAANVFEGTAAVSACLSCSSLAIALSRTIQLIEAPLDSKCLKIFCHRSVPHDPKIIQGQFCWICMGDWGEHGSTTGGFYKCNKYEAKEGDGDNDIAKAKAELDRYLHYYKR